MHRSQGEGTNLGELKGHIVKKIGVERFKRYFNYLSRFLLSQKLTKREFDKTCLRLLGRENLSLHNQLIRSLLRNTTVSKSPPPQTKHVANGPEQSAPNQNGHSVWSNGGTRKRKMRDSPVEHVLRQPLCREDNYGVVASDERDGEFLCPVAKKRIPCKEQVATAAVRDENQEEEQVRLNLSARPLVAPIGIQFCSAGGSRRGVPVSTVMSSYESGRLPDTEMLRKRMENIAVAHGLEGVSMECANTLKTLLDVYLKKLIKSCIDLVGGEKQSQNKVVNGSNSLQIQDHHHCVSLLDFRTAMELNPRQLGEDWPTLLESISMRSFKEQDLEV